MKRTLSLLTAMLFLLSSVPAGFAEDTDEGTAAMPDPAESAITETEETDPAEAAAEPEAEAVPELTEDDVLPAEQEETETPAEEEAEEVSPAEEAEDQPAESIVPEEAVSEDDPAEETVIAEETDDAAEEAEETEEAVSEDMNIVGAADPASTDPAADAQTRSTASSSYTPMTFSIGDNECVVTGFGADDAETLQQLLQNATAATPVELASIVDAEKVSLTPGTDSLLCWAGSSSNMLWLSGWAQQCVNPMTGEVFASEDEVFDYFRSRFKDGGCSQVIGLSWFFNGVFSQQNDVSDEEIAKLKEGTTENDGLYQSISAGAVVQEYQSYCIEGEQNLDTVLQALDDGNIVGLCIDGHALTVLGYIRDPEAKGTSNYCKSLIIADSDNSVKNYTTPSAERPNTMTVYTTHFQEPEEEGDLYQYVLTDYTPDVNRYIMSYIVLKPYSAETLAAATETNSAATLDAKNTADCVVDQLFFTGIDDETLHYGGLNNQVTTDSSTVYVGVRVMNKSYATLESTVYTKITITREEDGESRTLFLPMNAGTTIGSLGTATKLVNLMEQFGDAVGTYHVIVEVNPEDSPEGRVQEAYYLNNGYLETMLKVLKYTPSDNSGDDADDTDDSDGSETVSPKKQSILIVDDDGYCFVPFDESGIWGIHVIMDASSLEAFEIRTDAQADTWEAVPENGYTTVLDDDGTFRLNLTEAYMSSLGDGVHTFRVRLDGTYYTADITVDGVSD